MILVAGDYFSLSLHPKLPKTLIVSISAQGIGTYSPPILDSVDCGRGVLERYSCLCNGVQPMYHCALRAAKDIFR